MEQYSNGKRGQLLSAASQPLAFPAGSARCLWPSSVWMPTTSIVSWTTSSTTKVRGGRQLSQRMSG